MQAIYDLMSAHKYRLVQDTDYLDVYYAYGEEYNDVCVRMALEDGVFCFYLINQDKMIPKGYEEDVNKAFVYLYILCRAFYDPAPEMESCIPIRVAVKKGNMDEAARLIREGVSDEFFSLSEIVPDKISLIMERERGTALYQGKTIEKSMSAGRAYIVVYNCARWLARFRPIYEMLCEKTGMDLSYDDLAYIYILEEVREK